MSENNDTSDIQGGSANGPNLSKGGASSGGASTAAASTMDMELDEILLGSKHTLDENTIQLDESHSPESNGKIGLVVFIVVMAIIGAGIFYIATDEEKSEQLKTFFAGNIEQYKEQDKKAEEAQFRKVQSATRNQYGGVTLEYSPKDAKVKMEQLVWTESFDAFVDRTMKGGADTRQGPTAKLIPNKTDTLKEREMVDSLPFENLPLRQKTEDEKSIETYAYQVTIHKDLYYERTFLFITEDHPVKPGDEVEVLKFSQTGPDIFSLPWSGADLMPKPELMKPKYVAAIIEFNCYKDSPDGKKKTQDEQDYEFKSIKVRNDFATDTQWNEVETALRRNEVLWPQIEEEIKAGTCE